MPSFCVVVGCLNRCRNGFRFPKDPDLRRIWEEAVGRQDGKGKLWKATKYSQVCRNHFVGDDFQAPLTYTTAKGNDILRQRLKDGAIPSVKMRGQDAPKKQESQERSKARGLRVQMRGMKTNKNKCQCVELRAEVERYKQQISQAQLECEKQQETIKNLTSKVYQLLDKLKEAKGDRDIVGSGEPSTSPDIGFDLDSDPNMTVSTNDVEAGIISTIEECQKNNNQLMVIFKQFKDKSSNTNESAKDSSPDSGQFVASSEKEEDDTGLKGEDLTDVELDKVKTEYISDDNDVIEHNDVVPKDSPALDCDDDSQDCSEVMSTNSPAIKHDEAVPQEKSEDGPALGKDDEVVKAESPKCQEQMKSDFASDVILSEGRSLIKITTGKNGKKRVFFKGMKYMKNSNGKFTCNVCGKVLTKPRDYASHLVLHQNPSAFQCDICHVNYATPTSLRAHKRTIHWDPSLPPRPKRRSQPSVCDICGKIFALKDKMMAHRILHENPHAYQCDICQMDLANRSSLKKHKASHNRTSMRPKKVTCETCGKSFAENSFLRDHMAEKHEGKATLKCPLCPLQFKTFRKLNCHKNRHHPGRVRNFSCDICSMKFLTRNALKAHCLRKHFGGSTYYGRGRPVEPKIASTYKTVERGGKIAFQCDICRKEYFSRGSLCTHLKMHQTDGFKCDMCPKVFRRPEGLTYHKRVHSGEKPFVCEVCDRRFTRKNYLVNHVRTHTGEKPYQCKFCPSAFSQKWNAVLHERIHTKEKPYRCKYCPSAFSDKSCLNRHERKHKEESLAETETVLVQEQYQDQWIMLP